LTTGQLSRTLLRGETFPARGLSNRKSPLGASITLGDNMELTDTNREIHRDEPALPAYQKPTIRVMDEKEVLSAFQVTVAAITWWVM
jgi:hypothetical protein